MFSLKKTPLTLSPKSIDGLVQFNNTDFLLCAESACSESE